MWMLPTLCSWENKERVKEGRHRRPTLESTGQKQHHCTVSNNTPRGTGMSVYTRITLKPNKTKGKSLSATFIWCFFLSGNTTIIISYIKCHISWRKSNHLFSPLHLQTQAHHMAGTWASVLPSDVKIVSLIFTPNTTQYNTMI